MPTVAAFIPSVCPNCGFDLERTHASAVTHHPAACDGETQERDSRRS
jgi:hypothetical protein